MDFDALLVPGEVGIFMMPHAACPIDGQDDQIQKVTAVISSGSDALRQRLARPEAPARPEFIPDPPPPKSPIRARFQREGQLQRGEPAGKFDDDLFSARLTAVFVVAAAISFALAAAFVGITGTVFGGGTPVEPYSTNSGQSPDPFVMFVFALIAGAGVAAVWLTRYYRAVGEKLRVAEQQHQVWEQQGPIAYQALVSDWEANAQRVGAAQQLWATRLYYCARHDVVFLESDARTASPEAMLTLLDQGAPMRVAPRIQPPSSSVAQQQPPTALDAARILYDQERFEEARVELERLTQESPTSFMAWALLSQTLGDLWRREKSLQAAETAVRLNAQAPMALAAYASALNGDDRYSEGLIAAERALTINSQYLPALRAKAAALALGKRTEAALAVLESGLQHNPANFELLLTTASLLGNAERPGEAIAVCQNALRVRPESVLAHLLLATAYGLLSAANGLAGDTQASQRLVSQMMALHPQDFRVYAAQGAYYLAIGQPWQAVSAYNRALTMNRESEPLRRQRNTALAIALQPRKRTG